MTHQQRRDCQGDIMPTLLDAAGVEIPDYVDGQSLLLMLQGEEPESWRDALTNEKEKYIWFSQNGREQFFDLQTDPTELHDLMESPAHQNRIGEWREKPIQKLANRPEGFVKNGTLKASLIPDY